MPTENSVGADTPIQPPPTMQPIATPNPCATVFNAYIANPDDTSFDTCNRARIPGLTPLYNRVSEGVSANIAAGQNIPTLGVVIDGLGEIPGTGRVHGSVVVETANVATRRELFEYRRVGTSKTDTVDRVIRLREQDQRNRFPMGPIVNISQANLFSTSTETNINLITPQDVRDANALMVISTGNWGNNSGFTVNEGTSIELVTSPEQPAHNPDALREIHELTGSILMVAGLTNRGVPIINPENGFHDRYTNGEQPEIHSRSNRCGIAMEYCVAAPYTIYNRVEDRGGGRYGVAGFSGTSFSAPLVSGTLISLRYVWPQLTNRQLVRLACATAVDLGDSGIDAVYGCGQFSVQSIWLPTGELVSDPIAEFSLPVAEGAMQLSGASFSETVTVTGYENNEFARDYQIAVPASSSPTSLRIEPTISWDSLNTMLEFRNDGSLSLPVANGRGSAAHLFKDTFLFFKEANRGSALGLSHASGLSIAFERETDSFFGSIGSGSYEFGDTNKFVASFDRQFNLNETYGVGVKLAAAYGEMEPDISLIKSASGTAQTAQVSLVRKRNNFESRLEMNYNTGLKGTVSIQNTDYRLKPRSETAVMLKMRFMI